MAVLSRKRVGSLRKYTWLWNSTFVSWLLEHLSPLGRSICDVGAGDGYIFPDLVRHFTKVVAIEPSPDALGVLRNEAKRNGIKLLDGAAEDIPLPDNSVDVALAKSSLHHFASMKDGLSEMARIARRAIAVVEVISPNDVGFEFAKKLLPQKEPDRDVRAIFTEDSLKKLICQATPFLRALQFDQYIDIKPWLAHSDLGPQEQARIFDFIASQNKTVREAQQIHWRGNSLFMLRRMALVIGEHRTGARH